MSYGYVPPPVPPPLAVLRPTWFSRNWKWFLPTVIIVPILLIVVFVGGIFAMVFGMIKSSEPYHHALEVASQDPRVVQKLGAPIVPAWYVGGRVNVAGDSGFANLIIPLKGQLRNGTIFVTARKSEGVWRYQRLGVRVDGEAISLNLLGSGSVIVNPPSQTPTPEDDEDK